MATHLSITELQIGATQTITGISTSINSSNSTIPTSKAVKDFVDVLIKPVSLSVVGNWANPQYISQPVDTAGLIFIVTYGSGKTASVTPSVSPSSWSSTVGTQTATFSYTENGVTVSVSKTASVADYWPTVPLTLQAREAGNISISKFNNPGTIYYSKNGGSQTTLDTGVNIPVNAGDRVSFYRTLSSNLNTSNYFRINSSSNCYVYGNVMSLYNKDNFANLTTIDYSYAFLGLFNYNKCIDIDESVGKLLLPATTLSTGCYYEMFRQSSLTTSPTLPATTLVKYCYARMFLNCASLATSPTLPATTLAENCYERLFYGCTSLNSITCLATNISASSCTSYWVQNVSSSGTFRTPSSTAWTTGNNGIPSGWTRVNA